VITLLIHSQLGKNPKISRDIVPRIRRPLIQVRFSNAVVFLQINSSLPTSWVYVTIRTFGGIGWNSVESANIPHCPRKYETPTTQHPGTGDLGPSFVFFHTAAEGGKASDANVWLDTDPFGCIHPCRVGRLVLEGCLTCARDEIVFFSNLFQCCFFPQIFLSLMLTFISNFLLCSACVFFVIWVGKNPNPARVQTRATPGIPPNPRP